MFQHQGIWLPDGEKHFPDWMTRNGEIVDGKGTYQIKKLRAAMKYVKSWRTAVDVGGHVGLWSMHLHKRFAFLEAFEPMPQFRECWVRNVKVIDIPGEKFANLNDCALGSAEADGYMSYDPADSGGTHVGSGETLAHIKTLDSFGFTSVDFIKIDVEGFELEVLKGAVETLARCKPCVIVEQKAHKLLPNFGIRGRPAVDFLVGLGACLRKEMSGDYILSWD